MDFLCYCHDYVSRYGGLHMVRLDYCILDHILPTGKHTNRTQVRLKIFEKKKKTLWARLAQNSKITRLIWVFKLLGIYIHINLVLPHCEFLEYWSTQRVFGGFDNIFHVYLTRRFQKYIRNWILTVGFWGQTKAGRKCSARWAELAVLFFR